MTQSQTQPGTTSSASTSDQSDQKVCEHTILLVKCRVIVYDTTGVDQIVPNEHMTYTFNRTWANLIAGMILVQFAI